MNYQLIVGIGLLAAGAIWVAVAYVAKRTQTGSGSTITRATAFAYLDSLRNFFKSESNAEGQKAIEQAGQQMYVEKPPK